MNQARAPKMQVRVRKGWADVRQQEFDLFPGTKRKVLAEESRSVYYVGTDQYGAASIKPPVTQKEVRVPWQKKKKFRVSISWSGEVHRVWLYALTVSEALSRAIPRFARQLKTSVYRIRCVIAAGNNIFDITEVKV